MRDIVERSFVLQSSSVGASVACCILSSIEKGAATLILLYSMLLSSLWLLLNAMNAFGGFAEA